MPHHPLPILDRLRVASPCPESWDDMVGDERSRFCVRCAKEVFDLSAMTRAEAEHFLRGRTSPVCVTFMRHADGKVMTSDCPVGARRRRFGIGVVALAVVGAASTVVVHVDDSHHVKHAQRPHRAHVRKEESVIGEAVLAPSHARSSTKQSATSRITGCACMPGDPLCSCL